MVTRVYMETLSPTMEEGRIVSWLKHEGDAVTDGDVLAEVETDKAIMELQARGEGVFRKALAAEGATVEVGQLIGIIASPDEDISQLLQQASVAAGQSGERRAESGVGPVVAEPEAETANSMTGTATPAPAPSAPLPVAPSDHIKSSPLARRIARERHIDLDSVSGSGPGGRIIKRDVEAAAQPAPRRAVVEGEGEDVPLTQIRKTIASRLAQSLGPIPHFFLTSEIDMERVWDARAALNATNDAQRISFNDIVIKVVAQALLQHPECNAWWLDDRIRYFSEVHIAIAVAVEEGLITPVIRDAHRKSLREISVESQDLAGRARARKLKPDEYTGGTFSISNLGMFDIDHFTAVINPPEAGILAVGGITQRPVVRDGEVIVRRRMRVTMSCDHRVIDGATGAKFLQTVKRMLENPLAIVW